jgi:hypothetical protein
MHIRRKSINIFTKIIKIDYSDKSHVHSHPNYKAIK